MKRLYFRLGFAVLCFFAPLVVTEAIGRHHPLGWWLLLGAECVLMLAGGLWLGQRIRRRRGLPPLRW